MTYRQLLHALMQLDGDQLDCDVTVMDQAEEFYPVILSIYENEDVLFKGHPYLIPTSNGG